MAKRAMPPEKASEVKVQGHVNEHQFAALVGGSVNMGNHHDKRDVIDQKHGTHSVKSGHWWQIFLYGRERIATNTILRAIGGISRIMLDCIDAFPEDYDDYHGEAKDAAKRALQPHMRRLLEELQKPDIGRAFFEKALFDGGNAGYLSVYPGPAKDPFEKKSFHVFHKDDVVRALTGDLSFANSKARNASQMSDQKVVLKSSLLRRQIGEIEMRNDSAVHHREVKFRLNSPNVMSILRASLPPPTRASERIFTYGKAVQPVSRHNLPSFEQAAVAFSNR